MKTEEKSANGVQGTNAQANGSANGIVSQQHTNGQDVKKEATPKNPSAAQNPKVEDAASAEEKTLHHITPGTVSANGRSDSGDSEPHKAQKAGTPKIEDLKAEGEAARFAMNLEQTLRSVKSLHRLSVQRLALIGRIKTLEDFEVELAQENDELESNPYQGCRLIIKDDKGREFATNTPNLIRMVSQFIFDACHEKLADIESNIVFP